MLPDRRQIVLKMLINEYIAHALPIGSRTLIDRYHLDISSATVRNELSRLEDAGYLTSPHTSAGRVPTDFGYRTFVDDLLTNLPATSDPALLEELQTSANELDDLLDRTSHVLARFTNCLAMVVPSTLENIPVKQINLVTLSDHRLLLVVITEDGSVVDRMIETTEALDAARVAQIESTLNSVFAGSTIDALSGLQNQEDPALRELGELYRDPLLHLIEEEILECFAQRRTRRPHTLGLSHLLDQPEFSDAAQLSPIIEKLEDDTILFQLFSDIPADDEPLVRIGHENSSDELANISVVASTFGEQGKKGMVAIIGPTRMNYEQVIKAVRTARNLLQNY